MRRILPCLAFGLCAAGGVALAQGGPQIPVLRTALVGIQEVPAISTVAGGTFRARISNDDTAIEYELSYDGLEGTVTQAHIHVGQAGVNGGVSAFLCGTAASPGPAGTPVCPLSGTISGVITAAAVVGPAGQGVAAGELAELIGAIRAGVAYANVHSTRWPGGELRGQLPHGNHP